MSIQTILRTATVFNKLQPTGTLILFRAWLVVTDKHDTGGICISDLADNLGISYSSARRIVEQLGGGGQYQDTGLKLIKSVNDPESLKRQRWLLTKKGQNLKTKIEAF